MSTVRDYMIQSDSVRASTPVMLALRSMRERNLGFLPVHREDGQFMGIVTEGDLIRLIYRSLQDPDARMVPAWLRGADKQLLSIQPIKEVVTRELDTVSPDTSLEEAAAIMFEKGRRLLPVLEGGKPIGYLTRSVIVDILIS